MSVACGTAPNDSRRAARVRYIIGADSCPLPAPTLPIVPLTTITTTWPLLLGMGVLMLGAGLQSTLLGLRATLEGFPTPVTGAIMSCYYLGYLLGTIAAPRLVRRAGHTRGVRALAAGARA